MNSLNKSRYFELVAKDKNLQIKGTFLYYENRLEYRELVSYQIILEEQVFYANRSEYINLIQKYIDDEINCYQFQWNFFDILHHHMEIYDKLIKNLNQFEINFSSDIKMKEFSLLVNDLVPMCEFLDDGLSEKDFHRRMKKNLFKYSKI